MPDQNLSGRLADAALALGIVVGDNQGQSLLAFISQLQRWNRTYNLTSLRDPGQMLVQHVFDSLAVIKPLRHEMSRQAHSGEKIIVDVGSGGGLPGVVIAIMAPDWQVYCVDAVEKKMAFVRQMSGALALPNLHAVHARIEKLPAYGAGVVVSRAFASLRDFVLLAGHHAALSGCIMAMKGREPTEEIASLEQETDWRVQRVEPLAIPELDAQRCLVWMNRQGNP